MQQENQVQATIQFITDYHRHDNGGIDKLVRLSPAKREKFLTRCLDRLHGGRIAEFLALCRSPAFRPILSFEAGTNHPSLDTIHAAIQNAIKKYNEGDFGLQFEKDLGRGHEKTHAAGHLPPPDCVQWYWVNGEKVYKYNWDGVVMNEEAAGAGEPDPRYRLSLSYS